ncbi:hypothetical protein GGI09_000699, partial [Coemansia sp. S100]
SADQIAQHKHVYLSTVRSFRTNIVFRMCENSPLHPLALDLYRLLFLHPGCYGVALVTNEELAEMAEGNISAALRKIPSIYGRRDPLILRDTFEDEIVESLFRVLAEHRNAVATATDTI